MYLSLWVYLHAGVYMHSGQWAEVSRGCHSVPYFETGSLTEPQVYWLS